MENRRIVEAVILCQHDPPMPLRAYAAPDNKFGATGMNTLRPSLEKRAELAVLDLSGSCGDVQRRSTQGEQCIWVAVVMARLRMRCEGPGRCASTGKSRGHTRLAFRSGVSRSDARCTHYEVRTCV